eukprot:9447983-Pyramimonas_sp.AAC.1
MKLQGRLARVLSAELFPDSLGLVFATRLARWFPGAREVLDGVNWEEVRALLIKMRGPLASAIWKTLTAVGARPCVVMMTPLSRACLD